MLQMLSIFIKESSLLFQRRLHLLLRLHLLRLYHRLLLPPLFLHCLLLHRPQLTQKHHSAPCPPLLLPPPPLPPPPVTAGRAAAAPAASSPARITPASRVKLEPCPQFAKAIHPATSAPLAATALTRTCHLRCRALLVPSQNQALSVVHLAQVPVAQMRLSAHSNVCRRWLWALLLLLVPWST